MTVEGRTQTYIFAFNSHGENGRICISGTWQSLIGWWDQTFDVVKTVRIISLMMHLIANWDVCARNGTRNT